MLWQIWPKRCLVFWVSLWPSDVMATYIWVNIGSSWGVLPQFVETNAFNIMAKRTRMYNFILILSKQFCFIYEYITLAIPLWFEFLTHNDVIKWKHFPRYWPFVRGIHRCPVNSPHKGQWRGTLMFPLIFARINYWVNNGEAGDLRRYCAHYDVIVMLLYDLSISDCRL